MIQGTPCPKQRHTRDAEAQADALSIGSVGVSGEARATCIILDTLILTTWFAARPEGAQNHGQS